MSPPGCPKMWVKPCNRNAEESFPVLSLKSREQKPPNSLLIQDKNVLQPRADPRGEDAMQARGKVPVTCRPNVFTPTRVQRRNHLTRVTKFMVMSERRGAKK